jgi:predicted RNA binding protein YcfA (HicA-like mRNA interferase family)
MPKLPVIKDRELIRALRKLGFEEIRHDGTSHAVFKHPDGRRAIVAMHAGRDIPRGTLAGLLRTSGITVDQLLAAL